MNKFKGTTAMLIAAVLWGFAFSAQSSGMKFVGPMLFVMLRSIVGVAALLAVILLRRCFMQKNTAEKQLPQFRKRQALCLQAKRQAVSWKKPKNWE